MGAPDRWLHTEILHLVHHAPYGVSCRSLSHTLSSRLLGSGKPDMLLARPAAVCPVCHTSAIVVADHDRTPPLSVTASELSSGFVTARSSFPTLSQTASSDHAKHALSRHATKYRRAAEAVRSQSAVDSNAQGAACPDGLGVIRWQVSAAWARLSRWCGSCWAGVLWGRR